MKTHTLSTTEQPAAGSGNLSSSSLLVGGGLVLVLFIFVIAAWVAKRLQRFSGKVRGDDFFTVKRNQTLGQQGRLVVVEFNDQWLLLGVSSESINCLSTMDKPAEHEEQAEEQVKPNFQKLFKNMLKFGSSEGKSS
jgi:flagellar protein FliO/FliZ